VATTYKDNFVEVCKALDNALSLKTINEYMSGKRGGVKGKDGYAGGVINAIIGSAVSGIGPGNAKYARYKPSYVKFLKRKAAEDKATDPGAAKRYLRGIENTGRKGGMLGRERFSTEVDGSGELWIVWTSDGSTEMNAYSDVHQHGNRTTAARPWFHLDTAGTVNAYIKAVKLTVDDLVAAFNAKRMRNVS
jgi:hypothetical protein